MKNTRLLFLILIFTSVLILSACSHTHNYTEWETTTEASCTSDGQKERKCRCGEKEVETIVAFGHQEVTSYNVPPSCTQWGAVERVECSLCQEIISANSFIKPIGHSYVDSKCENCGKDEIDFSDISQYRSYEGYSFFETLSNGQNLKSLYDDMEKTLTNFHNSPINASLYQSNKEIGDLYKVAEFSYSKYNLTIEEAQTVYTVFRKDHPALYWISYWLYWNNGSIIITTVEEYSTGASRKKHNQMMYEGIAELAELADAQTSAYNTALLYYEAIVRENEYAYVGNQDPDPSLEAHSIMGAFTEGKFVCEGYAKLFQLLLNLSGIENRYVVGNEGSHVWNLVRLDDGDWYWFDLTHSDTSSDRYKYFAVIDKQFTSNKPLAANKFGMYFNFTLPSRSTTVFSSEEILEINEKLILNDCE